MAEPIDFPAPRVLTAEDLSDPVIRAIIACRDPDVAAAAWDALEELGEPEPADPKITRLDGHRDRRQ